MNALERTWWNAYKGLPDHERNAIDRAFNAAIQSLTADGFKLTFDKKAEILVAAMTKYVIMSKE